MRDYDAIVFDLDGTLADTMPAHYSAWRRVLDPMGIPFPEGVFYGFGGVPTVKILEILAARHGIAMDIRAVSDQKEDFFAECLAMVRPVPEVLAVARAHRGVVPMAVATGGHSRVARRTLDALGIGGWFGALVTAEDVTHGKPHPEPFALAARKLGVEPARCLAYEDADPGIASAAAAGMRVIDVRLMRVSER